MATEYAGHHDPLRNPQVDYEPSDLSPRGILFFLVGLFVSGLFIELVLWGMFHFLARSEALFPSGTVSPMASAQQRAAQQPPSGSILQNTPPVNLSVFPEPRLQANDAGDMQLFLHSEQMLLNPPQPFKDPSGAVHIPISMAMKLIEERGLPTRPSAPPKEISTQMESDNPNFLYGAPGHLPPGQAAAKPGTHEDKQKQQ